ncbi:MAG: site-specific DNA-methyltransferase [Acidobacterium ailaaui]|nr:site-specific DNA-methyltransferase [Pseudacidobacterium ailaaui]
MAKEIIGSIELNRIYQMDCIDGMRLLPDNSVDLTVTSPPYDNLRTYNGYSFDFENVAKELYRVTKPGGVVVWVVADETKDFCESMTSFKQALYFVEKCGFKLLDTMIYYKKNYAPAYPTLRRYANQFEYMFVFVKGKKPKTFNPIQIEKKETTIKRQQNSKGSTSTFRQKDGTLKKTEINNQKTKKIASNVWQYSTGAGNSTIDKIAFQHPAIFPELLVQDHIISWSNLGEIVLDPFIGSGTTAKMALLNNRNFIGFEISEEYVRIANQRLENVYDEIAERKLTEGNDAK